MKTPILAMSLITGLSLSAQASSYSYSCWLPHKAAAVLVTVDTGVANEVPLGSVQPLDKALPEVRLALAYNHNPIFKPAYGRVALVARSGKARTAVYANLGQSLIFEFESGEVMPGNWGGGPPATSEFYVVCDPVSTNPK